MDSSQKVKAPRYSATQWEAQKTNVERLYIEEDRPLKEVIQILAREFGFQASEKQLKSRLPKWGFDTKNLKGDIMVQLARAKAKRKLENKESSFRVSKKTVDDQKIERYLRRHEITDEDLLAMASPVDAPSPAYSVFTPQPFRSPTPDAPLSIDAALQRSPSSGLNFQALSIKESRPMSPIVEGMTDEDFAKLLSGDAQLDNEDIAMAGIQHSAPTLTPTPSSIIHFNLPSIDTVMKVELKLQDPLQMIHDEARNALDTLEEQINPPSTPAEVPGHDIVATARRIASFHGSVVERYLAKIMHRSRLRDRFADQFQDPGLRQVWYCHVCHEYYASDFRSCPTFERRKEEHAREELKRKGLVCINCNMEIAPNSSSGWRSHCFMCSVLDIWMQGKGAESNSSDDYY
ncbi:uncharacterized protein LY89DRAFT_740473 [Mollisia scopiformis]|uniref:Clr5 domain-containing protein n=1 Tax=Mollisia scopiformis TaxID=149040 RepID=A0A132BCD6_MOLSC|nr:uncharacterized protein LY89DRAFT_740473 [Mollisia scopiformis]KUJ10075.1 hypothetical protein LY89DRAFT_740473 [Mollisia scopiformis]